MIANHYYGSIGLHGRHGMIRAKCQAKAKASPAAPGAGQGPPEAGPLDLAGCRSDPESSHRRL